MRSVLPLSGRLQAHLSQGRSSFMENQAVEVVCQIGEREFGLRSGKADGADEQAIAALLVGKDVLDPGPHG